MLINSSNDAHQPSLSGNDLLQQLDPADPLLQLSSVIPWSDFDQAIKKHYTQGIGAPSKPIWLMVGLLILKQLENLSDESVVLQWKRNPCYQAFCGLTEYQPRPPCHSTELVHFRKRIGKVGIEQIFQMSVRLHGRLAQEDTVNIDTTVQEKNITYPTDARLAIKTINHKCIASVRAKIISSMSMAIKYPSPVVQKSNLIVGVVSHELNLHDIHTLPEVLKHIEESRGKAVKTAVCDRGYRGKKEVNGTRIMLPAKGLKRDNRYQRDKKRKQCKRRAAIEPIIGHLKSDFRLSRNFLKGVTGDEINLLMAATAWNLKKWLIAFFGLSLLPGKIYF